MTGRRRTTTIVDGGTARARFSELIRRTSVGEEVLLTRSGEPVARLLPVKRPLVRQPGSARGRVVMAPDFDAPLDAFREYRR